MTVLVLPVKQKRLKGDSLDTEDEHKIAYNAVFLLLLTWLYITDA